MHDTHPFGVGTKTSPLRVTKIHWIVWRWTMVCKLRMILHFHAHYSLENQWSVVLLCSHSSLWEFLHISLDDQQKLLFFFVERMIFVSMVQWAEIKNYYIALQSLTRGKICCELWRTWEAFVSCVIKFHIFNTTIKKINDSFSGSLQWHFSGSLSFIVYRTIHSSYDNCMWFAWMSFFLSSSSLKTRRDILISFQSAKYNKT